MDAVRPSGRDLVLTAADAHDTGATRHPGGRLLPDGFLDPRLPPWIRGRIVAGKDVRDGRGHFGRLRRIRLRIHAKRVPGRPSIEGFAFGGRRPYPLRGMPTLERATNNALRLRHPSRRTSQMLQWNTKVTAILATVALLAIASDLANFTWRALNFTW